MKNLFKNIFKLAISLMSTLFAIGFAYALSRYFEDMSGAVLFISGLLIGEYLKKERHDI